LEREGNWILKFKEEKRKNIDLEEQIQNLEKLSNNNLIEQPLFADETDVNENILEETHQVYKWLNDNEHIEDFKYISTQIKGGEKSFNELQDDILYFVRKGLIIISKEDKERKNYFYYQLSKLGEKVLEKIYYEENNTI